jgi:hypothetical protein
MQLFIFAPISKMQQGYTLRKQEFKRTPAVLSEKRNQQEDETGR